MIRMSITHPLHEPMVNMMFQTWTASPPHRPCQSPPPHTGKLFHPPHTDGRSFFKIVFIFLHFTQFCGIEIELFTITTEKNQPKLCRLKKSTKTLQVERCAGCARPCQASGRECVQLFLWSGLSILATQLLLNPSSFHFVPNHSNSPIFTFFAGFSNWGCCASTKRGIGKCACYAPICIWWANKYRYSTPLDMRPL